MILFIILSVVFCWNAVHGGLGGSSERHIPGFTHKSSLWKHAAHRADVHGHNVPPEEVISLCLCLCVPVFT